jgi:hypothetical protein
MKRYGNPFIIIVLLFMLPTYRNHPVGQVTILRNLHTSKHSYVYVATFKKKKKEKKQNSMNGMQMICNNNRNIKNV